MRTTKSSDNLKTHFKVLIKCQLHRKVTGPVKKTNIPLPMKVNVWNLNYKGSRMSVEENRLERKSHSRDKHVKETERGRKTSIYYQQRLKPILKPLLTK